jgi:uncharacterized protein (TIGR03545 family)
VDNSTLQKPRFKKKGPIRVEALVPFFIFVGLIVAYFTFLFDFQMRKSLEWVGTQINRAEVNVGSFKTSFWNGSLLVQDIQVTQVDTPTQNRVQIGKIQFQFLWDALLRAKFVVNTAAIQDFQTGSPRKSPGKVLPPEPEKKESGWLSTVQSKLINQLKDRVSASPLGSIAQLLEGFDPTRQLKDLGELKSIAQVEQLKTQLDKKKSEWNQTASTLLNDAELSQLQTKVSAIRVGGTTNPAEISTQINQATGAIKESQQKVDSVRAKGAAITQDVSQFNQAILGLDEIIKKDRAEIESKLKLPRLDAKNLAEQLFGPGVFDRVAEVERYIALARKYMPSKSAKKVEEEKPPRGVGKTYSFGRQNSYPLFWLKRAELSSKSNNSPFGGDVVGELLDFSTDQSITQRPAVATVEANFPQQLIHGITGKITLDHTREIPQESILAQVKSFPVPRKSLSESESVKFALTKATGSSKLEGMLKGNSISLILDSSFQKVEYEIKAQSKILETTLQGIVKDIPTLSVKANLGGTWDQLSISIQSNLASALQNGFEKQLQARLQEARQRIDDMINSKIGPKKKELTDQYAQAKTQVTAQIEEKQKKATELKNQAQAKLTALQNQASSVQNQAKDAIKSRLRF